VPAQTKKMPESKYLNEKNILPNLTSPENFSPQTGLKFFHSKICAIRIKKRMVDDKMSFGAFKKKSIQFGRKKTKFFFGLLCVYVLKKLSVKNKEVLEVEQEKNEPNHIYKQCTAWSTIHTA
jgi:hypothetical protein